MKVKPAVPPRSATTKLRGRLDKSHSTPAYDLSEEPETCDSPISLSQTLKPDMGKESDNDLLCDSSKNQTVAEAVNPVMVPKLNKLKEEVRIVEVSYQIIRHLSSNLKEII